MAVEATAIAEPTQALDMFAAFAQQRVVDDQVQQAVRVEPDDYGHGNLAGQVADGSRGTTEEVIEAVEGMPLFARNRLSAWIIWNTPYSVRLLKHLTQPSNTSTCV